MIMHKVQITGIGVLSIAFAFTSACANPSAKVAGMMDDLRQRLKWSGPGGGQDGSRFTEVALGKLKGKIVWTKVLGGMVRGFIPVERSIVYPVHMFEAGADSKRPLTVMALSEENGEKVWDLSFPESSQLQFPLHVGEGHVAIQSTFVDRNEIVLVKNGNAGWTYKIPPNQYAITTSSLDGKVVFVSVMEGGKPVFLSALDRDTGKELYNIPGAFGIVSSSDGYSYSTNVKGQLTAFSTANGAKKWMRDGSVTYLSTKDRKLCLVSKDGSVKLLDLDTSKEQRFQGLSGPVRSTSFTGSKLYVAQENGLLSLDVASGKVQWRLNGSYDNLIAGSDDTLLIAKGKDLMLVDGTTADLIWRISLMAPILQVAMTDSGRIVCGTIYGFTCVIH